MKVFSEQLELAKQSGDPARLAATHSSIGVLLGENQENYPEALPHFDESYRINTSLGARVGMGWDQANRATTLWQLGRYEEARAALDEARSIAAEPEAGFKSQLAYVELIGAQMALSLGKLRKPRGARRRRSNWLNATTRTPRCKPGKPLRSPRRSPARRKRRRHLSKKPWARPGS